MHVSTRYSHKHVMCACASMFSCAREKLQVNTLVCHYDQSDYLHSFTAGTETHRLYFSAPKITSQQFLKSANMYFTVLKEKVIIVMLIIREDFEQS